MLPMENNNKFLSSTHDKYEYEYEEIEENNQQNEIQENAHLS